MFIEWKVGQFQMANKVDRQTGAMLDQVFVRPNLHVLDGGQGTDSARDDSISKVHQWLPKRVQLC